MSTNHSGNLLNQVTFEEHDGDLNAKKMSLVSAATIYAVTSTTGGQATVTHVGLVTLAPSPNYIGLVTIGNSQVTVTLGTRLSSTIDSIAIGGNVTVEQGDDPWNVAAKGNVTLSDAKTYVGLVTATSVQGGNWDVAIVRGNVTVEQGDDPWNVAVKGNVTLSNAKTFIGLVTSVIGRSPLSSRATQGNASIGTAPFQVLASDTTALDTFVYNISNTTIFVANETISCNASLGVPVFLNDSFSYTKFTGTVFAVANAGSGEVRFWRSLT